MTHKQLHQLDLHGRDLAERSLHWLDHFWDEEAGLLCMPEEATYEEGETQPGAYSIRETAWYALGLLLRAGPGDHAQAMAAIAAVLTYQYDRPGLPYHGTWARSPDEPQPPAAPVEWRDYDPNWREFIGSVLAVVLLEYESLLPAPLVDRVDAALRLALEGSQARNVPANYTNIALMAAFLWKYGADRFGAPELELAAERLASEVIARFRVNNTFDEYNSPTYYGVNLYALALWRSYSTSPLLRAGGAELEAALWRDIAQFYHAGLGNIAGPYDRSYGMNMRRYVALLGLWLWLGLGREHAPFPELAQTANHVWDFAIAPVFAVMGARIPDDVVADFISFRGERRIERVIVSDPRRVATAWLGRSLMLGAEAFVAPHRVDYQFHPATVHWLTPDGGIGWLWLRLNHTAPLDACAADHSLTLVCTEHDGVDLQFIFQLQAPAVDEEALRRDCWLLPGLTVQVATNTTGPDVTRVGDLIELRYTADAPHEPVHFTLRMKSNW